MVVPPTLHIDTLFVWKGKNMRELLFRGKRKDNGEWVEGYLCIKYFQEPPRDRFVIQYKPKYDGKKWQPKYAVAEIDPETVGQYTGLTDKNGKKIFEGDIVEFSSKDYMGFKEIGKVVFCKGCFGIEYVNEISRKYGDGSASFHRIGQIDNWQDMGASGTITYTYQKVGNIYDNPKLLGGNTNE